MRTLVTLLATLSFLAATALAQPSNRIDVQRPDAPELAAYGPHDVGVRTMNVVDEDRLDILAATEGEEIPRYDRPLTLEVWYPATLEDGTEAGTTYTVTTRDGSTQADLTGRAVRDATPNAGDAPYPLVIVSHGYPGNRFLLSHLSENLASKGYVVAAIDHTDSMYSDQAAFASTLYNRPLDQLFVLDEMERFSAPDEGFLSGLVDASTTAIVGYSMGAYGAVNVIGGGYTEASTQFGFSPPNGVLAHHQAGTESFEARQDPRVVAAIAIAPWGMNAGFWNAEGLAGIDTPVLFMAGSVDDVAGYENGTRAIFEGAVNADRYLLTFQNANHNAAAPIPAPREAWETGTFDHYGDAVWDTVRMNNVAQHFATAFLAQHLKADADMAPYLDLVERAADGVWSVDDDGEFTDEHTYWKGFPNRTAVGLILEHGTPQGD
ncbi:MAG: dienelactone hydrolase [Trueperaceae bacterium]|nr:dienelactone hydrolase [Trueperaceae bacterium]